MFAIVPRGQRQGNLCVPLMSWKGKLCFLRLMVKVIISIGGEGPLLLAKN